MLSRELEETLRRAMSNAASRSHEFATLEHLLLALTDDDDAREVLTACNVDIAALLEKLNEYIEVELASIVSHSDSLDVQPTANVQAWQIHAILMPRSTSPGAMILRVRVTAYAYSFSSCNCNGCSFCLAYCIVFWALLSATSKLYTPHTPTPRWCTFIMILVASLPDRPKNCCNTCTTNSIGV